MVNNAEALLNLFTAPFLDPTITSQPFERQLLMIANKMADTRRCYLWLLDNAHLLDSSRERDFRKHVSQIYNQISDHNLPDVRLGFIATTSRRIEGWEGLLLMPEFKRIELKAFTERVISQTVDLMHTEREWNYGKAWCNEVAKILLSESRGLPALLREYLLFLKAVHSKSELSSSATFEDLAHRYIKKQVLNTESLVPTEQDKYEEKAETIGQLLHLLSPFRIYTDSHLQEILPTQVNARLRRKLARYGWDSSKSAAAAIQRTYLNRPPRPREDRQWVEVYPAIRQLLFRYFYPDIRSQVKAHDTAAKYYESKWLSAGSDHLQFVTEYLWHLAEKERLQLEDMPRRRTAIASQIEDKMLETIRDLFPGGSHPLHGPWSPYEITDRMLSILNNDEEFRDTLNGIQDGLHVHINGQIQGLVP